MTPAKAVYDVVVVGGGLAGLMAAARAEALGAATALIDAGVPGTPGELGGFAPFSGAKFSLFPAGTGISPLVGGDEALIEAYQRTCAQFAELGFPQFRIEGREAVGEQAELGHDLAYRRYHSILLSPGEIVSLLAALSGRLQRTRVLRATAINLSLSGGPPFGVELEHRSVVAGERLIVAAGRLGSSLLERAGVPPTRGKGIDVGVRLGFANRGPLLGLRSKGPDAKFMADGVRTFCLNSPGRIFHYPGLGFQLPGGIVADPGWSESNVGVLCRLPDKAAYLRDLAARASAGDPSGLRLTGSGGDLGWTAASRSLLGEPVVERLTGFIEKLMSSGLVDLPPDYAVHYPLLDWHWPVFSLPGRLGTSVPGVLAAGDASGHARGLLQAAVMGTLAAEESLS